MPLSSCGRLPDAGFLTARPFAHRGLYGAHVSENGLAAFDAAIAAGVGIECDVRPSRDGVAIVFHDARLTRLTGADGLLADRTARELEALSLADGGQIPRLTALLERCAAGTPLLIEVKIDGWAVAPACAPVAEALAGHRGAPFAVMSFNPFALRWFARRNSAFPRGLVVTAQGKGRWRARIERALAMALARPDFVACDIRDLPSRFAMRARARGLPVLTWTVRTDAQRAVAAVHADQIIFEDMHG